MVYIGSRLKQLRLDNGMTQKELSDELGVSRVIVTEYENCRKNPGYETLIKIADIFQVTTDYLLGRAEI